MMTNKTTEPGYKAVLVVEESKCRLQEFRKTLPDRDLHQERRLVTAGLDLVMDMVLKDPSIRTEWLRRSKEVARKELFSE